MANKLVCKIVFSLERSKPLVEIIGEVDIKQLTSLENGLIVVETKYLSHNKIHISESVINKAAILAFYILGEKTKVEIDNENPTLLSTVIDSIEIDL